MSVSPAAWGLLVLEVCVVLITAFGIVSVTYQTRGQFALIEQGRRAQQVQWEEWGRLLLEESAFSSPSRVERVAREQLEMILPSVENIRAMEYK
ncbi:MULTISPECIES: cell division protein FtsL [Reinekea]|jgi:cell division protein FtsL|uniref:Cell division protein FtsL n=1 Tax=Reinekea forsetii TaxID=1336806 RepID=A0A2K8KT53_9GAMM|nr:MULTISPECIES: cell division protein FtsL [Reinekea]ATX77802.1 cell division protein FtsL [Reinekea forsetii]